jgi:hypothetical protein
VRWAHSLPRQNLLRLESLLRVETFWRPGVVSRASLPMQLCPYRCTSLLVSGWASNARDFAPQQHVFGALHNHHPWMFEDSTTLMLRTGWTPKHHQAFHSPLAHFLFPHRLANLECEPLHLVGLLSPKSQPSPDFRSIFLVHLSVRPKTSYLSTCGGNRY